MKAKVAKPFAHYGCEKMIYDVRMGPMAVHSRKVIYIVYQANPNGHEAHPHIITYDLQNRKWSEPVQIGTVKRYDHHFAPIVWIDHEEHIHVLFNCHGAQHSALHMVSASPGSIAEWRQAPMIAPSITYPRVVRVCDDRILIFYRALGHMGYWSYQISDDGGYTWTPHSVPVIDFDQNPRVDSDTWAGTYHSVCPSKDGRSLHIAFVYWDERKGRNALYKRRFTSINRHHLYYLRLDIPSGCLYTFEGNRIETPVTREHAERCKIWDTGLRLTNMPSIFLDNNDQPSFLVPVSEEAPWKCRFYFVTHDYGYWMRYPIVETNHTWSGSHLTMDKDSALHAYLTVGNVDGETFSYGGGDIEEWVSGDSGVSWTLSQRIVPEPDLLYNNPRPVENIDGSTMDDFLLLYGWEGPGSIQTNDNASGTCILRGKAYLWNDGEWL
ncbi:BNR-4 repeat-containing protein [Candidatus Poribacteria bacterium]